MREIVNLPDTKSFAFTNSQFITGKSGGGKTNSASWLVENYNLFGKRKCFDFDTTGRLENVTYSLAEDDSDLVGVMGDHPDLVRNWGLRPMGFADEVFLFCGRGLEEYPKLPKNLRVISFAEEDLGWEYLVKLLGDTPPLVHTLNALQAKFGMGLNMRDIQDILFGNTFRGGFASFSVKGEQRNMIKNRIASWKQSGLFSSEVERLNFEEIVNDRERITCFNTFLLESELEEEIAVAIVLDKLLKVMKFRKAKHRFFLNFREISEYMGWPLCRGNILKILRKGRMLGKTGIDLCADTQRAKDLKPKWRSQFGYYQQMKANLEDAKTMLEVQEIPFRYISKVPHFGVGQSIVATGVRWDQPLQCPPCRHKHVSVKFDTLKVLGDIYGWNVWDTKKIFAPKEEIKVEEKEEGEKVGRDIIDEITS